MKIYVGAGDRRETDLEKLRVPMPPKIEIIVQDFVGFISEYASNISQGGMFIGTDAPHPAGTELEFDIHLAEDKFSLISGRGVVAWARTEAAGADRPMGMGIRFSELEGDSLALIQRMVDNFVAEGGTPFELEREAPPAPGPPPEPVAAPAPPSRPVAAPPPARAAAEEAESLEAVRSLGHSDRGLAPGMEPSAGLEGQEERARAPKPKLLGVEGEESPGAAAAQSAGGSLVAPEARAAGPVQPSSLLGRPEVAHPAAAGPAPPVEDPTLADLRAAGIVAVPAAVREGSAPAAPDTVAAKDELESPGGEEDPAAESNEPSLELDQDGEMSLDLDDDDFSIEFDTTNSLESERQEPEAASTDVAPEPEAAVSGEVDVAEADVAVREPVEMPDLSQTLGQGMVGAGTGFFEAMQSETEGVEARAEAESPTVVELEAGVEPAGGDIEELEEGDASALEELVAELQSAPEATSDIVESAEPPALEEWTPEPSPLEEWTAEPFSLEDGKPEPSPLEERTPEPIALPEVEPVREAAPPSGRAAAAPLLEAPPVGELVLPEVEQTRPYATRPGKRRARRSGQLRRWSILLVLLGGLGSGMFYVREKGVELLLGPGSAFSPPSQPLAESEELAEIVPSTLLELMQEEKPQVEIVELEASRQRQVRPLTLVENVTWQETDRTTILTLWGNGDFTPSSTAYVRLDGETSREVLQIRGAEEPYWAASLKIRTLAVDGLRFGYRVRKPFNEVHLAVDLHRPQARVRRIELDGRRLRVFIR